MNSLIKIRNKYNNIHNKKTRIVVSNKKLQSILDLDYLKYIEKKLTNQLNNFNSEEEFINKIKSQCKKDPNLKKKIDILRKAYMNASKSPNFNKNNKILSLIRQIIKPSLPIKPKLSRTKPKLPPKPKLSRTKPKLPPKPKLSRTKPKLPPKPKLSRTKTNLSI